MCLRFADRPCFIARAVPDFSTGIQIFRCFYSIRYVVKPFTDTIGFCQSKMATFSSLFVSKNVITKIRKACLKQQVIIRWLEIFNDNYPCNGVFPLWVYFPLLLRDIVNRGLELSEERKLTHLSLTTMTRALLFTRVPGMFLLFSVEGNIGENLCFAFLWTLS